MAAITNQDNVVKYEAPPQDVKQGSPVEGATSSVYNNIVPKTRNTETKWRWIAAAIGGVLAGIVSGTVLTGAVLVGTVLAGIALVVALILLTIAHIATLGASPHPSSMMPS